MAYNLTYFKNERGYTMNKLKQLSKLDYWYIGVFAGSLIFFYFSFVNA